MIGKCFMKQYYLKKKEFYSNLNVEKINAWKRVCKDFEIKYLGENYDLYLNSDILLLADVFENFKN